MNRNHLVINLLFLSNCNVLGAAFSANHEFVLAAAVAGSLQTVAPSSDLYDALKHNNPYLAFSLLDNGARVGPDELIRAVKTCNRQLTLTVLNYAPYLLLNRRQKTLLRETAEKARDIEVIRILESKHLITFPRVNPPRVHLRTADKMKNQPKKILREEALPDCVICLEPLKKPNQNEFFFQCSHDSQYFHDTCVKKSIQTNKKCPLCRASIQHKKL